ncbi:uncharacterized protein LOC133709700 [Rosa rugosa]|uniref:uncharacterized protein LOC133709700 n=1 Tax=Rosa rugosa TaxID=74645 RepID=UPI002B404507|nr:uncharacterized protein LOC133709700 [Rosa rugosa]
MESKHQKNVELIDEAIKRLLEERRNNRGASGEGDDDQLLLSQLLSQLESVKGNSEEIQKAEASNEPGEVTATSEGGELDAKDNKGGGGEFDKQEIVRELKNLKRQNTITHWLLSVLVVLTIAWQASEMTLLLKMKHGLSHPFSCIRTLFSGGSDQTGQDQKRKSDALPSLKMLDLPSVELPDIGKKH